MQARAVLALTIVIAAGPHSLMAREPALPGLPQLDIEKFLPTVRHQVQQVYALVRRDPKNAEANGKLGMVLDVYEQYESAAICYQRAHLLQPDAFRWLYYLGWVQSAQGKHEEAAATLQAALQLDPEYLPARIILAESLLACGRSEESGKIYEAILKTNPNSAPAYYGLGRVCAARGDLAAAAEKYRKACERFPPYRAAHYALALVYRKLGEAEKSREQFALYEANRTALPPVDDTLRSAVVELDVGATSHMRNGVALEEAGKIKEAVREYEAALTFDPKEAQAHINLISLYAKLDRFDKADQHYRAAVSLNSSRAEAYYNYGLALVAQSRNSEAQRAFERALRISPYFAEAHNNLGFLFDRQGRKEEALKEYQKAVEDRPNYALAHFHIGHILMTQEKYDEAIQHFLKALTPEDESTPGYLYALAVTYAMAGQRKNAARYAQKARAAAVAHGQTELLRIIDKDLRTLEQKGRQ